MVTNNPHQHNNLFDSLRQRIQGPKPSQQLRGFTIPNIEIGDTISLTTRKTQPTNQDNAVYVTSKYDQDGVYLRAGKQPSLQKLAEMVAYSVVPYNDKTHALKNEHVQLLKKGDADTAALEKILTAWGVPFSRDPADLGR
jgi:hypothetical protein